jgi:hypothetical protein
VKLKIALTLVLLAMLVVPAAIVVRARLRRGRRERGE